jgi:hypothetical protein
MNNTTNLTTMIREKLINIRNKIKEHNLIVTKADKGNTLVIMQKNEYNQKIDDFITPK